MYLEKKNFLIEITGILCLEKKLFDRNYWEIIEIIVPREKKLFDGNYWDIVPQEKNFLTEITGVLYLLTKRKSFPLEIAEVRYWRSRLSQ